MDIQPIQFLVNEKCEPIQLKDEAKANYTRRKIMEVRVDEAREYHQIGILNLSGNELTEFSLRFLYCLPNLIEFDLSKNKIAKITGEIPHHNLCYLSLSGNKLTEFPLKFVNFLPNLVVLDLSNNSLPNSASVELQCQNIENLYLSEIGLAEFPLKLFNCLPKLKFLHLGHNRIANIPIANMKKNKILDKLILDGNELTKFPSNLFNYLPNLQMLFLSSNRIDDISGVIKGNIHRLSLSGNKLKEFPSKLFNCLPNLRSLNLSNNRIANISNQMQQNENITDLNLSGNELTKFPSELFNYLPNLLKLDLSNNRIDNISNKMQQNDYRLQIYYRNIRNITDLNLSGNKISKFSLEFFNYLPKLEVLDLSNNRIANITNEMQQNENLRYIYLNNNNLKEINLKFINNCPKLEYIYFNSNKLEKIVMTENLNESNNIKLINFCSNRLNPFLIQIYEKKLLEKIDLKYNLDVEQNYVNSTVEDKNILLAKNEGRIDLLIKLFEHNQVFINPRGHYDHYTSGALIKLEFIFQNLIEEAFQINVKFPNIKYYFLRQHDFQYYFIFFFLISNSKLNMENLKEMIKKCDELTKKFEKNQISFLDFLIEIKMDTNILLNLENKINKETLYVELNFFSGESIEKLCERNNPELFDLFFPDKILRENEPKLPYLVNDQKFLWEINFENCFKIVLENKNEVIATKLLLLYNYFRKRNKYNHEDHFSKDFISNFISLIKFFSESNSKRKLDAKPIRDLADDFWSPPKKAFYIGFVFIYFVMLIILSWKILKKNSLNEQLFFKYENYLIILISATDVLKFLFAFIMSIVFLEIKLPIFIQNIISRCFYSKRNEQRPVERNENKTRKDDHPGNNIRFKDSKNFYSYKLFFELINSILLILAVLFYPKLISISIIFVFGVFIFKFDKCVRFGRYVRVLSQIIMKSIPFLIIFVVILFGFWISFHMLLIPSEFQNINGMINSEKNESIAEKIIKFVIMGAGNLESDNFPIPGHNPVEIFSILFVYLTFIFSIPVIVINLFGGISNYEIKNMFDKAEIDDAVEKIQYSINLDKMKEKMKSLITRITYYPIYLFSNLVICLFITSNLMKLPNPTSENRNKEENSNEQELQNLASVETIHEARF